MNILSRMNATTKRGAATLAVIGAIIASPAMANSSANTDITAPLRSAPSAATPNSGDQEFSQLFTAWRSMDQGNAFASASTGGFNTGIAGKVSIPSRQPLDTIRLTSDFGMRWHPVLGGRREHAGVDLGAAVGTPIYATADGVVGRADWFGGYGLCVELEHGGDLETRYGHMSRIAVASGQMVHKGEIIGYVGATGRTTGPHLHYEVRVGGVAVNPMPYLQGAVTTLASATVSAPVATGVSGPAADADGDE